MLLHWQYWKWIQQKGKSPIDAHKWAIWIPTCQWLFWLMIQSHNIWKLNWRINHCYKPIPWQNFALIIQSITWNGLTPMMHFVKLLFLFCVGRKGYVNTSYLVRCGQWLDHGQCCWGCTHTSLTDLSGLGPETSSSEWVIRPSPPVSVCFRSTLVQDPAAIICKLYHSGGPSRPMVIMVTEPYNQS